MTEQTPEADTAPWIVRKWYYPGGVVVGLAYALVVTGALDGTHQGNAPGALVIGVGVCWLIDRIFVRPLRGIQ
jgi:hypothetical protein